MQFTDVFEENRAHLRSVAVRLLGSGHDADDAVQQTWLKAHQADLTAVTNLPGWLTTVISRECLDMLRARCRRPELSFDDVAEWPSETAELDDTVGVALLVVLDRLSPKQRAAFVLHDLFGVPFADIAAAIGTTPAAAKKLASRARRDIHGAALPTPPDQEHLRLAEAFLTASRDGDIATLLDVLAPDVVRHVDAILVPADTATEVRGARAVAEETRIFASRARAGAVVLIDGAPGIAIAAAGRLRILIRLTFGAGRISAVDITDGFQTKWSKTPDPGITMTRADLDDQEAHPCPLRGDDVCRDRFGSASNCPPAECPTTEPGARRCCMPRNWAPTSSSVTTTSMRRASKASSTPNRS